MQGISVTHTALSVLYYLCPSERWGWLGKLRGLCERRQQAQGSESVASAASLPSWSVWFHLVLHMGCKSKQTSPEDCPPTPVESVKHMDSLPVALVTPSSWGWGGEGETIVLLTLFHCEKYLQRLRIATCTCNKPFPSTRQRESETQDE